MVQTTKQEAAPTLRWPDIEEIQDLAGVKDWLRKFQFEMEAKYRALRFDDTKIFETELPDLQTQIDATVITAEVPLYDGLNFRYLPTFKMEWDAGTITYGGTTYTINAGEAAASSEEWIYVDVDDLTDGYDLQKTGTPVTHPNRWFLAHHSGTLIHPALQSTIIHGGLIQADTVTANAIEAGTITANEIETGTITANEIEAGTITANEITGTTLSAIYVDSGTLTAGFIGSANNHFDIDNSELEVGDGTDYVRMDGNGLVVRDSSATTVLAKLAVEAYSTTNNVSPIMLLRKNASTGETLVKTTDNEWLGAIVFLGVDDGAPSDWALGTYIVCNQVGAAGSANVSSVLSIVIVEESVTTRTYVFDEKGVFEAPVGMRAGDDDGAGKASFNTLTGVTENPTTDPGWTTSSSVNMNAPDGYIKFYVGTQAVSVPYWNT